MTRSTEPAWVVLIPVKRGDIAKSRLTGVTRRQRTDLARAFPADCAAAVLACERVHALVVVTDDEVAGETLRRLGAQVVPDEPDAGLNPALQHACAHARETHGPVPLAVLSGDLPALRPPELSLALDRARQFTRAFVPDQSGDGTTLLTAAAGAQLDPRFGADSRRQHLASGAHQLDARGLAGLRRDVDTPHDLQDAIGLGVGRHTRAVLVRHRLASALH
jgi:2-phospho-L-lactate/phosphoenolpyruvate guanylyltransferase